MKTNLKHKAFSITSIALLSGSLLAAATSCSQPDISTLFFKVTTDNFEVEFCDQGASIYSMKYKDTAKSIDEYITYGPKDKNVFLQKNNYYGKALGRVAGRIKDGKFKLSADSEEYQLEKSEVKHDEHNDKDITLHGGVNCFSTKKFNRYVRDLGDRYTIAFNYFSKAGECGFPEDVDAWFTYTLHKHTAQMDINIVGIPSGPTPLNMSTHPYIRLGSSGTVAKHKLTIPTNTMAKFNFDAKNQIVTGTVGVKDSYVTKDGVYPFDFSTAKTVDQDFDKAKALDICSNGYDHIWCSDDLSKPLTESTPFTLENSETKIKMDVTSDANAFIVYASCWPNKTMDILPSGKDEVMGGITIEPVTFFKDDGTGVIDQSIICTPDKPFTRTITYKLSTTE